MATAGATGTEPFLPGLTTQLEALKTQQKIETVGFCQAMSTILPIFDSLGERLDPQELAVPSLTAARGICCGFADHVGFVSEDDTNLAITVALLLPV